MHSLNILLNEYVSGRMTDLDAVGMYDVEPQKDRQVHFS